MHTRLASLCLVLLAATMASPGLALAMRPLAVAAPGTYSCKAASAANQIQEPPPLWETTGKLPTAEETAAAEATKPLCPAGEVPSAIASTHEATADRIAEPEQATTAASASPGATPPTNPYGGETCNGTNCYWYVDNYRNRKVIGMEYATAISEPHVSSFSGAHSIDQLALEQGEDDLDTVEAGWDVDPGMWPSKPDKPHFFVFINKDKYEGECEQSGKCYDDEAYWTPLEGVKITMGEALEPSTAKFDTGAENFEGNWWIWAGKEWIGYVSSSFWGGKFTKAERASNYGEVNDSEEAPTTAMGDGEFGSNLGATPMSAPVLILSETEEETTGMNTFVTNSKLYSLGQVNSGKTSWRFGGPGVDPPDIDETPSPVITSTGEVLAFGQDPANELLGFDRESGGGWKDSNITELANGNPNISGTPTALVTSSGELLVFARNTSNELIGFWRESGGGWKDVNITELANGKPDISETPEPIYLANGELLVSARNSAGELIQFYRESGGGWKDVNITGMGNPDINETPMPVVAASGELLIFARNTSNELTGFWRESGGSWKSNNITGIANGKPDISETPEPIYMSNGELLVFSRNPSGELLSFWRESGGGWKDNNITGMGNSDIDGTPRPLATSTELLVFARNTSNELTGFWRESGGGWKDNDITGMANGTPDISEIPAPLITSIGELLVFARGISSGELFGFYRESGGGWKDNNITRLAGGI